MSDIPGSPKVSRKLAAILAADIAGYSALMGADEGATVRDLKRHQAVILPIIGDHGGRVIDTAGDGILAEFGSVVNAVECAIAIQRAMTERNAQVEEPRRMPFRIGVNQGDVIQDEVRIYGDGVNVAARLESIAEPGGICISGKVYDEITGKIPATFQDLGLQQLKNIAQLVRVYRVQAERASVASAQTRPALALPDKPSIAVLPFANLSGDPKEDYFSDGITADIITELSRFSELFVIARNSSFQYKGKSPDIRQVGRELGVRYVLEGSIRRAGDRVRITGQLIDAVTGVHRWADRYDRDLKDIFAVQDEVAHTIVSTLAAHVRKAESERVRTKPPNSLEAYDYFLQAADALASFNASFNKEDLYKTRHLVQQSLARDPDYARSYAILARTYDAAWIHPLDSDHLNPGALDQAHQLARKAVQLDANLPLAHVCLGVVQTFKREHDAAIAEFERAIALNPNYVDWPFAMALVFAGYSRRAINVFETYRRLDPFFAPVASAFWGMAHYMLKEYSKALPLLRDFVSQAPESRNGHVLLAAIHAQLGQLEEASAQAAAVLRLQPSYTITGTTRRTIPFKDLEDERHFLDGLRKAGLPE
jgi:adenylate cyclase